MSKCDRCGKDGHAPRECPEKRFAKLWPEQFAFRGKIRAPDGSWVELECSLGEHGARLMAELTSICMTGKLPADLLKEDK
jgi:hypothetical protein